ncbi:MAG: zinc-ribbon domain-containing protein [Desulfobulbaceae bacterium]|nr:zinc-ribbon domain-containing protein [Desulfobulbaceae bacterium]
MISACPHCQQDINLNDAQLDKLKTALAALPSGKTLKLACPKCKQPIEFNKDATVVSVAAAVLKDVLYSDHVGREDATALGIVEAYQKAPKPARLPPEAPKPPDTDWLDSGVYAEKEIIEDVPRVMVLSADEEIKTQVTMAFGEQGFQPVYVQSAEQAIDKMQFGSFDAIVLHSRFEGGNIDDSTFHQHMRQMFMAKRRYIFYTLIGPEFRTLYDLEALANSANLVVNDKDVGHLGVILKKGMSEYDDLFGPYIDALKHYGVK